MITPEPASGSCCKHILSAFLVRRLCVSVPVSGIFRSRGAMHLWLPDVVGREVWDRVLSFPRVLARHSSPQVWGKKPSQRCVYWLENFGPSLKSEMDVVVVVAVVVAVAGVAVAVAVVVAVALAVDVAVVAVVAVVVVIVDVVVVAVVAVGSCSCRCWCCC